MNMILYGFPKTGKTTLASHFIDSGKPPAFIATERGHDALGVSAEMVTSYDHFLKLIEYLEKNIEATRQEHSCLVVDLISDVDQFISRQIENDKKVDYIHDLQFGKGSKILSNMFSDAINRLLAILPCTFLAHSDEREIVWNGEKIKVQQPNLNKATLKWLNGKVDLIGFISPSNNKDLFAELYVKPNPLCIAGCRYSAVTGVYPMYKDEPNKTIKLIRTNFNSIFEGAKK